MTKLTKREFLKLSALGLVGIGAARAFVGVVGNQRRKTVHRAIDGVSLAATPYLSAATQQVIGAIGEVAIAGGSALALLHRRAPQKIDLITQTADFGRIKDRLLELDALPMPSVELDDGFVQFIHGDNLYSLENIGSTAFYERRIHLHIAGRGFKHTGMLWDVAQASMTDPEGARDESSVGLAVAPATGILATRTIAEASREAHAFDLTVTPRLVDVCCDVLNRGIPPASQRPIGTVMVESLKDLCHALDETQIRRLLSTTAVRSSLAAALSVGESQIHAAIDQAADGQKAGRVDATLLVQGLVPAAGRQDAYRSIATNHLGMQTKARNLSWLKEALT